jgi:hypothetical protein
LRADNAAEVATNADIQITPTSAHSFSINYEDLLKLDEAMDDGSPGLGGIRADIGPPDTILFCPQQRLISAEGRSITVPRLGQEDREERGHEEQCGSCRVGNLGTHFPKDQCPENGPGGPAQGTH